MSNLEHKEDPSQRAAAMVSMRSVVVAIKEQISSDLVGEAVILDLKTGVYYGLDEVGARIWNLMLEPKSVTDIRDTLLFEYEVDANVCEQDLLALLQEFRSKGLIEILNETVQ